MNGIKYLRALVVVACWFVFLGVWSPCHAQSKSAGLEIRGSVFEDRNGNGIHDTSEPGIGGAAVSDGERIFSTDRNGRFAFKAAADSNFIQISSPGGYRPRKKFYYSISDQDRKTGAIKCSFAMRRAPQTRKKNFCFIQITDTHTGNRGSEILPSDIEELNKITDASFVVNTGDLTERGYERYYRKYMRGMAGLKIPRYDVSGNHDWHGKGWPFIKKLLGPTHYSFDQGLIHFVVYDDMEKSKRGRARQNAWLKADFARQKPGTSIIVFKHYPPGTRKCKGFQKAAARAKLNVLGFFVGHWHMNNVYWCGKTFVCETASAAMGGIDWSAPGYRLVRIKGNKVKIEYHPFGLRRTPAAMPKGKHTVVVGRDWRRFRGDRNHTGYTTDSVKPPLNLTWVAKTGGRIHMNSPVVASGKVFVAIDGIGPMDGGAVIAYNAANGVEKWRFKTPQGIKHTPCVEGNRIYALSTAGRLYCLNVGTGRLVWKYQLGDNKNWWTYSPPAVIDGTVYFGVAPRFVALDARTGKKKWTSSVKGKLWVLSYAPPLVTDKGVWVQFGSSPMTLFDRKTGKVLWQTQEKGLNKGRTQTAPALTGGKIFLGGKQGGKGKKWAGGKLPGPYYALKTDDGSVVWQVAAARIKGQDLAYMKIGTCASPAIAHGMVYIGGPYGEMIAVDVETGKEHWSFQTKEALLQMVPYRRRGASILSSPAVSGDVVYFGAGDGNLYALSAKTGEKLWSYFLGVPIASSPAVSGNAVFIGAYDGNLYAFTCEK